MKDIRQTCRCAEQSGFTLIEVMVAMAVFAFVAVSILRVTQDHTRSIGLIERQTYATWVANNKMAEALLQAQVKWPLTNNQKGEVQLAGQQWYWRQEVKKTDNATLNQVTVIVASDENMQNEITSVTAFVSKVVPKE